MATFQVGFLVFPSITQLDLTGPFEVFSRMPGAAIHLIAPTREPVVADSGLTLSPTTTYAECPRLDLICVPGGPGVLPLLNDSAALEFLVAQSAHVRYITSVCTGSMVLGAAGLLVGKRATCHWMSRDFLEQFGAIPETARVVRDGNVITGGGVTAGIDFALTVVAEVADEATAQRIQLMIEYDPAPPFAGGTPATSPNEVVNAVRDGAQERQAERARGVATARDALVRAGRLSAERS
ncbi:MAG: DJ-1/PfpI family protein [Pseudomonadota bacterium]